MRQIVITKFGGYDVLKVQESADPVVSKGKVKVAVKAVGLNFAEVMARQGMYPDVPTAPYVVGYEAAGIVTEIGEGVTDSAVGTRVVVVTKFGGHSDTLVVDEKMAIPIPDNMTFAEAASIPVNYITAYHMLFRVHRLSPGERVLVHMAAGGVGVSAIQLCKTVDNVQVFGTASASKHDFIRELGCEHPIDYNTNNYQEEIANILKDEPEGRRGMDIILDPLGDFKTGYALLNPVGKIMMFGVANMINGPTKSIFNMLRQYFKLPSFSPLSMMDENKSACGVNIGHLFTPTYTPMLRQELIEILDLWKEGKIKSIVSKEFTFEQAGDAHRYMEERKNIGKIIMVPTEADFTPATPLPPNESSSSTQEQQQ
eukprot:gene6770-7869_t